MMIKIGLNYKGDEVRAECDGTRELWRNGEKIGSATLTGDPASYFTDDNYKTTTEKFLGELAEASGEEVDALRAVGLPALIPGYIAESKTVDQIATCYKDCHSIAKC